MCAHRMNAMAVKDRPDVAAWRAMLYANDRLLKRLAEEMLREQGLELSWYEVLMHLAEARGAITQRELVELTLMGQSGLSRVLAKLEAVGFVRRVAVESDRRNLSVELTDRGRERLRRAAPLHLQGIKRWFADPMTARQVDAIRAGLERVLHNLAEDSRAPRSEPEPVAIGPQLLSLSADGVLTADAIVVRDALEPLMLADAVRYARPDDVGELRRLLSAMTRRLDSPVDFLRADWALHRRIAQISPNEVLRRVSRTKAIRTTCSVDCDCTRTSSRRSPTRTPEPSPDWPTSTGSRPRSTRLRPRGQPRPGVSRPDSRSCASGPPCPARARRRFARPGWAEASSDPCRRAVASGSRAATGPGTRALRRR
jgi:DNA-binding MarR family transcriptional regulator